MLTCTWSSLAVSELGEHRKIVECLNNAIKILQGSSLSSGAAQSQAGNK